MQFPHEFIAELELVLGSEKEDLLQALDGDTPTSIRFNPDKCQDISLLPFALGKELSWAENAYYLDERPSFTADPLFHLGYYYVQEASSMLLDRVRAYLPQDRALLALDLCAAPGGKSTLLSSIMPKGSLLVSNEVVPSRANILKENILKWGNPYNIVTSSFPDKWHKVKDTFDVLLVDAPCSGEGMFRKDLNARSEWTKDSPKLCAIRQKDILENVLPCLRAGGLLIYSTCTFNRQENEEMVSFIQEEFDVTPLELSDLPQEIVCSPLTDLPCYRMYPHRLAGEGLFMAVFRKNGAIETPKAKKNKFKSKSKKGQSKQLFNIGKEIKDFILSSSDFDFQVLGDSYVQAFPREYLNLLQSLQENKIAILNAGILLGNIKGKDFIPHQALALSQLCDRSQFEKVELDEAQALLFLAKQEIKLDPMLPRGIKLLTYQGANLGFVKHIGSRTNNLYPNEWRIRQLEQIQNKD